MVHTMIEVLWFVFLAGLAVAFGLAMREIAKGLLDNLFEEPTTSAKCKTCYDLGFDSSGQSCKCKVREQ